jgi:all-trans-retinol dehydrogenase (NAD+)
MGAGVRLDGSRVLITGGGSGIGRLMALGAAERGASVVVWDRDGGRAQAVRDEIRGRGAAAEHAVVDVTDAEAVKAAASATAQVDVLVNNAGVVAGKRLLEASEQEIRRTFEVNTLALYWVTRAFLPGMIARRRGTVVTVSSAAGLIGVAQQTDYSASKFAALGFAESLRAELRLDATGVHSLVVCPYYIDTGMFEGVQSRFPLLLPILHERHVATKVLDAVEKGRTMVVMPPLARTIPVLRALPVRWFDAVADLLGVNQTMAGFTGRVGDRAGDSATAVGAG